MFIINKTIMGEYNSSLTRVAPLGEAILKNHELVNRLLKLLPNKPIENFGEFKDENVFFKLEELRREKSLCPTKEHLTKIIEKIENDEEYRISFGPETIKGKLSEDTINKRKLLFSLDKEILKEAKKEICNVGLNGAWYKLEGDSCPDLFIENENFILLVEGKRTENSTTKKVSYLRNRSQMVRHIENAIDYCNGQKKVIAFYIVEEGCGYENECTPEGFAEDLKNETIEKSCFVNYAIKYSFYGYTTWQAVKGKFGDLLKIQI